MKPPVRRCAIYTRKSSEEGLEQSFNSLDAQREACEAYIKSQASEGWRALPARYDDGGYSGGSMQRPGLQKLLFDISSGKIDIVVVYKIDRLTRALADFARMVELFEQHAVSFVSVTQSFNTTSSMGRLTLNVLLSFAQFEREVTGERIRDKIAASKKKGMWMGGSPPLGYDLPEAGSHSLRINKAEAETVRWVFESYLELKSVHALVRELDKKGVRSKTRTTLKGRTIGGEPFSRGALFHLLRSRVYLGEVPHKDQSHPGLHDAIIEAELFEAVQVQLDENSRRRRATGKSVARSPLAGRIFDTDGQPMSPTFAYGRGGKLYRYYVSASLQRGAKRDQQDDAPRRVSATALEARLLKTLIRLLPDLEDEPFHLARRIEIHAKRVDVLLTLKFIGKIGENLNTGERAVRDLTEPDQLRLTLPWRMQTRGGRTDILAGDKNTPQPDPSLIRALRSAHAMLDQKPRKAPTLQAAPTSPWRRNLVRLAFLAPDIQRLILNGGQPDHLTLALLMKEEVPLLWSEQHRKFAIDSAN
ncbi:recombinase family protein [uncultured Sneathiella sp.]|jgi:DNA invertase Pin-like site-specific DNA recombinase|uniref:recombinase family protein n=1 Tax=uncultured Sneathiella sp. TaxID=879315 RepID=UPI0030D8B70C|tara:strand:- start:41924 stop:43516 length:1593 start_codon:yes stop_codon:yes gene_type:complete